MVRSGPAISGLSAPSRRGESAVYYLAKSKKLLIDSFGVKNNGVDTDAIILVVLFLLLDTTFILCTEREPYSKI
jgi:hypothetical protein